MSLRTRTDLEIAQWTSAAVISTHICVHTSRGYNLRAMFISLGAPHCAATIQRQRLIEKNMVPAHQSMTSKSCSVCITSKIWIVLLKLIPFISYKVLFAVLLPATSAFQLVLCTHWATRTVWLPMTAEYIRVTQRRLLDAVSSRQSLSVLLSVTKTSCTTQTALALYIAR